MKKQAGAELWQAQRCLDGYEIRLKQNLFYQNVFHQNEFHHNEFHQN